MGLNRNFNRKIKRLGHKSSVAVKKIGQKAPNVLKTVGKDMMIAGKVGEAASGVLALAGQEELAVPLLGASEALKYGGKATQGAGKTIEKVNDGDYKGAIKTGTATAVQAKKDKMSYDKNADKRNKKLSK